MKSNVMITPARLAWACKRGMSECEFFLAPLLASQFGLLSETEKSQLYNLLQIPDPILYEWFTGRGEADAEFKELVKKLRSLS